MNEEELFYLETALRGIVAGRIGRGVSARVAHRQTRIIVEDRAYSLLYPSGILCADEINVHTSNSGL